MARIARALFLAVASVGIIGFAVLPLMVPRDGSLARVSAHSQTAQAEEWYVAGDDPADYPQPELMDGSWSGDAISTDRSPESQAYIDQYGYGYAPCMDSGDCDYGSTGTKGGSLKDDPYGYSDTYSDAYYDEPYGTYYEDTYYDEPSYGARTGGYVAAGLAQVPLVLANALAPRTATYNTYTTTYVPNVQQVQTYAVPQYQYVQQPVQYQQSGTIQALTGAYTPRPQIATTQQVVDINRVVPGQTVATIQQPVQGQQVVNGQVAQITGGTSYSMAAQPVAVPAQTTHASFFAVPQQTQQVVRVSSGTGTGSSAIGIAEGSVRPTCSIRAKPSTIAAGATTTISWSAGNADTATLDPMGAVALVGSSTVRLATTTTFTLVLDGAAGKTSCSVKVAIDTALCLPGCPPGYTCSPIATSTAPVAKKSGFWSWFGL